MTWSLIGFSLFISSLAGYVVYTYQSTRTAIMAEIDEQLLRAAKSTQLLVGDDYHDRLNAITPEEFQHKSVQLTALAKAIDVEYVYTMVYQPPHVHFTASSYTKADIKHNKLTQFLDHYKEATTINKTAFQSTEPVFEVSRDKWGHFKSIFVPYISSNGTAYIAGADMTISQVDTLLQESVAKATLTASFFFFIAVLVAIFYIALYRRSMSTDPRTGFANRVALEQDLSKKQSQHLSLAIISIDELEDIISFYGTHVGDRVLKKVMEYFKPITSPHRVYRLATSKLVIMSDIKDGEAYLSRIIADFPKSSPVLTKPHLYIQLHAGIATGNKSLLLENASIACRQAKQGNQSICMFSVDSQDARLKQKNHLAIANILQDAFADNRVATYFTPRVDPKTQQVVQHGCSARIVTEQGAILKTESFSEVVRQSRLQSQLTRNILTQCIDRFRKSGTAWSIKLSYHDATDPQLLDFIDQELRRYPQPRLITFELDEKDVLEHFNAMAVCINVLKSKGVKVLINAVSSGLLTVSRVMKLNIDMILLDESNTTHIADDEQVFDFIKHIAKLCHDKDIMLLVAGVESEEQYNQLSKAGVDLVEGRHIATAAPHLCTKLRQLSNQARA
ncbi:bifunctional diguanylate cyclase/phosphodiesterase [Pseudoalteromonas sp. S16_S37]|uniref:bifunctional diguanylate cyclase/phosphodiesterase n=1 Tax=Pseudoalteromonas sp. S16_S37 TaxID=2720228 RepID=UPI001EEDD219|nr:GGDEF domain-containing protein [Pseudoalteromonas sp. S16_S37]